LWGKENNDSSDEGSGSIGSSLNNGITTTKGGLRDNALTLLL